MKKHKLTIAALLTAVAIILFSLCSADVIRSVKYSLTLCYSSVIPSLFPFFILCEFLMSAAGGISINPMITAFGSGLITGFPTGVRNVCALYTAGTISRDSAVRLLYCTANASPAYIVAFIGTCIIGSKSAGIILLISQTLCALTVAVFFGCFKRQRSKRTRVCVVSITDIACTSIGNSVISCLYVCGYIVFFGIIADIAIRFGLPDAVAGVFRFLPEEQVKAVFVGFIEITRGMLMIDFNSSGAIVSAAVILAFSGISVIMQCVSCTVKCKLPATPIFAGKIIYALFLPLYAFGLSRAIRISPKHSETGGLSIISFLMFFIFVVFCIIFIYYIFDKSSGRMYNGKKKFGG